MKKRMTPYLFKLGTIMKDLREAVKKPINSMRYLKHF
jgi:hypothetical protein